MTAITPDIEKALKSAADAAISNAVLRNDVENWMADNLQNNLQKLMEDAPPDLELSDSELKAALNAALDKLK